MDDILTNPWTIVIVGTIIAGLVLYYFFGVGKTKPVDKVQRKAIKENSIASRINGNSHTVSKLLPKEITDYIASIPPMQRVATAESYSGIRISWKVGLSHSYSLKDGKFSLALKYKGLSILPLIKCTIDISDYPQLKVIKTNELFTIQGQIEKVDPTGFSIDIENGRLLF